MRDEGDTAGERVLDEAILFMLALVFLPIIGAHVLAVWLVGGVY